MRPRMLTVTPEELAEIQSWADKLDKPCTCSRPGFCERHGTYHPYEVPDMEMPKIIMPLAKGYRTVPRKEA